MTQQRVTATAVGTVAIRSAGYVAEISEQGAALLRLRHRDRDLVFHVDAAVPTPPFRGAVLAPWPNRVANGRYRFAGQTHQLPVNEVGRGNALHGLALWERWSQVGRTDDAVIFEHVVQARPGYPFTVAVRATYTVDEQGLRVLIKATNLGPTDAPVGLSAHPYLGVGDGTVLDEWTMRLPCREVLLTDDRLLPRHSADVHAAGLDFRSAPVIGSLEIDHAFTGIDFDTSGRASAVLTGPGGAGVRLEWDTACRWLQVYTLHVPGDSVHRRAVAIEPMTCAPDAFNSGDGLLALPSGGSTSMAFGLAAVPGDDHDAS